MICCLKMKKLEGSEGSKVEARRFWVVQQLPLEHPWQNCFQTGNFLARSKVRQIVIFACWFQGWIKSRLSVLFLFRTDSFRNFTSDKTVSECSTCDIQFWNFWNASETVLRFAGWVCETVSEWLIFADRQFQIFLENIHPWFLNCSR